MYLIWVIPHTAPAQYQKWTLWVENWIIGIIPISFADCRQLICVGTILTKILTASCRNYLKYGMCLNKNTALHISKEGLKKLDIKTNHTKRYFPWAIMHRSLLFLIAYNTRAYTFWRLDITQLFLCQRVLPSPLHLYVHLSTFSRLFTTHFIYLINNLYGHWLIHNTDFPLQQATLIC